MAELQEECDRVREMFVQLVARNRGVSPQKVFDTQAGTFMGDNAVPLLADAVGHLDDAMKLAASAKPSDATTVIGDRLKPGRPGLAADRHIAERLAALRLPLRRN